MDQIAKPRHIILVGADFFLSEEDGGLSVNQLYFNRKLVQYDNNKGLDGSAEKIQADLASRTLSFLKIHVSADPPGDYGAIIKKGAMAGEVGEVPGLHHQFVDSHLTRSGWELDAKFFKSGVCIHFRKLLH